MYYCGNNLGSGAKEISGFLSVTGPRIKCFTLWKSFSAQDFLAKSPRERIISPKPGRNPTMIPNIFRNVRFIIRESFIIK